LTEVKPFASIDLEFPSGLTVAASLRTVKFQDVVSSVELDAEIELGGFTSLPDVFTMLLHDLSVHHGDSSTAEVSWGLKSVHSTILTDWEGDLVVVTNVLVYTLAQGSVGNLKHILDNSLTISFSGFLSHQALEFFDVSDSVLSETNSLDEDHGISWFLSDNSLWHASFLAVGLEHVGVLGGLSGLLNCRARSYSGFTASAVRGDTLLVVNTSWAARIAPFLSGLFWISTSFVSFLAWNTFSDNSGGHDGFSSDTK